jgi:ABC-type branched-subunit amino acid transport system substrate-binding protein
VTSPDCLSEEKIAELVEGRLEGDRLAEVERHLAGCAACRRLVAALAKTQAEGAPRAHPAEEGAPVLQADDTVGRYVIRAMVGAGAMGRVYAAHDPALDRKVALKLLNPNAAAPDLEERLLREAKAMARVSHPHVIAVHDAGRHGRQVYIAMEFVAGGTLRDWLAKKARPWREVLEVFLRAGRGLAEAHAAGIIHRDFKPDNVLVGDDGRVVRVTDFGLAREAAAGDALPDAEDTLEGLGAPGGDAVLLTRTGALIGTPAYMSPEQHAGRVADERSDEYGFCIALYEGLYGARPFVGPGLAKLQAAKAAGEVVAAHADRRVPSRLRRALLVGLRAEPAARYASMTELLAALERATRTPRAPYAIAAVVVAGGAAATWAWVGEARHPAAPATATASGASSAQSLSPAPECTTNAACVGKHGGEPWLCRASDRTCVAVASQDCTPRFEPGDLEADDTVWLGAMFPAKGPLADAFGGLNVDAVDFARKEFAQATRSLTGAGAPLRVRRIALAVCDDADAEAPARAGRHLVDDVGVPAILGFRSSQELVDLGGSLLVQRGVLSVASLTSSPLVTQIPQPADRPRMVWRSTFSSDAVATATAGFVHDVLEPRRAPQSGPTRVALVRGSEAGPVSFGRALLKSLVFNGKTAIENGPDYQEIAASDATRDAERLVAANPSFVVLLVNPATAVDLVSAVEARWSGSAPRPVYLAATNALDAFVPFLGTSAERRRRLFGVVSTSTSAANAHFVIRFNEAHERHVSRTENPGSSYDAFYLLAYGVCAIGSEPVTGTALAGAFARLVPPGRAIEVGPTQVFEALTALSGGGRIDLEGTDTGLDFDLNTGEAPADFALLCAAVDRRGRVTGESIESGLVFRAKTRRVEGTMRCP